MIQALRLQTADLEATALKLRADLADRSEVSGLRKTLKRQQDQNQQLEAKCAKLLYELEKTVQAANLQQLQACQAEM